jgi:hypothetical protein
MFFILLVIVMADSEGTSNNSPIKEELSPEELKHIKEQ